MRTKIGHVSVDAGILWLGDPCYILHKNDDEKPSDIGRTWEEFCEKLEDLTTQFEHNGGHEGLGVVTSTGLGDGLYPVYADIVDEGDWGRRVKSVTVEFMSGSNDDLECDNCGELVAEGNGYAGEEGGYYCTDTCRHEDEDDEEEEEDDSETK